MERMDDSIEAVYRQECDFSQTKHNTLAMGVVGEGVAERVREML